MFWQEETSKDRFQVPDAIVDLAFNIDCRELPVDHAYELSHALRKTLGWVQARGVSGSPYSLAGVRRLRSRHQRTAVVSHIRPSTRLSQGQAASAPSGLSAGASAGSGTAEGFTEFFLVVDIGKFDIRHRPVEKTA